MMVKTGARSDTSTRPGVGAADHASVIEWPTVAVAVAIYTGFALLTWNYHALPWWLVAPAAGLVLAWYGSLVHEVIHGHPTRHQRFNDLVAGPCLWLWVPYGVYRDLHLRHHRDAHLTDPLADPESWYLDERGWDVLPRPQRWLRTVLNTLAGRLVLGPPFVVWMQLRGDLRAVLAGDRVTRRRWLKHLLACAPVLWWVLVVCRISFPAYLLLFVWPGIGVSLLRSFAEHRAAEQVGRRTAVVECGPLFSLLFLNNNLHVVHHALPGAPWYQLPALWRDGRARWLAANGGYLYAGYSEIARRYLLVPREPVLHPLAEAPPAPSAVRA